MFAKVWWYALINCCLLRTIAYKTPEWWIWCCGTGALSKIRARLWWSNRRALSNGSWIHFAWIRKPNEAIITLVLWLQTFLRTIFCLSGNLAALLEFEASNFLSRLYVRLFSLYKAFVSFESHAWRWDDLISQRNLHRFVSRDDVGIG